MRPPSECSDLLGTTAACPATLSHDQGCVAPQDRRGNPAATQATHHNPQLTAIPTLAATKSSQTKPRPIPSAARPCARRRICERLAASGSVLVARPSRSALLFGLRSPPSGPSPQQ